MYILVTGATGYIGREFVKVNHKLFNIVVLVRESSDISDLELLNCRIVKFKDFGDIDYIFEEIEICGIVHFASTVIVEHKRNDINTLIDSNIKYGTYLLELCKKHDVKWFINTGTFWQNFQNEKYNPVNLYAATKEAFQNIARYYTETSNLIFTTIKLNDTFGPNDTRNKIFNLWNKISKTGETLEMSAGEQIIDISYIDDIVSAYEALISHLNSYQNEDFNNKTFVVTSNEQMSLKELSKVFEEATNTKLKIKWGSRAYRDREVMNPWDNGESIPNWKQKYTLKQAIQKTIGEN